jgi:hypothetical protein
MRRSSRHWRTRAAEVVADIYTMEACQLHLAAAYGWDDPWAREQIDAIESDIERARILWQMFTYAASVATLRERREQMHAEMRALVRQRAMGGLPPLPPAA